MSHGNVRIEVRDLDNNSDTLGTRKIHVVTCRLDSVWGRTTCPVSRVSVVQRFLIQYVDSMVYIVVRYL